MKATDAYGATQRLITTALIGTQLVTVYDGKQRSNTKPNCDLKLRFKLQELGLKQI